jgi:predicted nucleic acid-binding protein
MSAVVSDTSPIRALAHLGHLDLLALFYGVVLVPPAVAHELLQPLTGLPAIDVSLIPFFRVQAPSNTSLVQQLLRTLQAGEVEALALTVEIGAPALLIDEVKGRAEATRRGVVLNGTLGVLLRAKQRGLLAAVAPLMDRLVNEINFFISPILRATVLRRAGESPTP